MGRTTEPQKSQLPVPEKKPLVESIVITLGADMTYAQIVINIKQNVKAEEVEVTIHNVKKTASGNALKAPL